MIKKRNIKQNPEIEKVKFLSDQPLTADREQEIRFGHLEIAKNLKQQLLSCPTPFTIGLFGKWGSGKTTILNVLIESLKKDKVAAINFDVWKHEDDALRRTFLKELFKQLKSKKYFQKEIELSPKLEHPISITKEFKLIWNWKGLPLTLRYIIILLIIFGIIGGLLLYFFYPSYLGQFLSIIFGGSLISGLIFWLIQHIFTHETLTETFERFKDPHEFETEFEKLVSEVSSEKLVIIIDNLDRCTHDKAVKLLSTIKTFLAKDTGNIEKDNKCIFLIACDDEAIKKHLESVYKIEIEEESAKASFSADEFLRKFFNTFIFIPDFIDTELQSYTEYLLKEIEISQFDSSDVAHVITTAFRENPRQIKQFINILISHFLLAQEREKSKEPLIVPKGTITNNVAFLAKLLIIRQKFPSEYQRIKKLHLSPEEIKNNENKEFNNFLRATKTITVPNIRPFIYLRQSEEELLIPGIRELEVGLLDNNKEVVREKLKIIKDNISQFNSFKRFIISLIVRNRERKIPLQNIISSSLDASRYHDLKFSQEYYDEIADLLSNEDTLKSELYIFEPSLIFNEILKQCRSKNDRAGIINQYIYILRKEGKEKVEEGSLKIRKDYASKIFNELITYKDWLNKKQKDDIRETLTEVYSSYPEILSLFKDKIDDQKDFISEEAISKFISTFSNDDVENEQSINDKVELLLNFKEIIIPSIVQGVIEKMVNLLKNENTKPYREQKESLLNRIEDVLDTFHEQTKNIPDPKVLNTFADTITQGINALSDLTQKRIFVFTCLKLVNLLKVPAKSNINTLIQNFFNVADVEGIKFIFDKFDKRGKEELIKEYLGTFNQRILQQQPIFDLLYPISPQDIRTQWLISLINSAPGRATQKLKDLSYKVDDKRKVVEALLGKAQGVAVQEKGTLYEAINKMRCANDSELRSSFASQIKPLLENVDQNSQKVGYNALQDAGHLSAPVKREIVRETTEWLRSLKPPDAGQPYSVRSVILNRDILKSLPSVQRDYIDFVFDKLIKRGVNIDNIKLGVEILSNIKPKYEDYSPLFDDALARAESEGDNQIKSELENGLLKLKPPGLNKKNRKFWEKLEKLSSEG